MTIAKMLLVGGWVGELAGHQLLSVPGPVRTLGFA